MAQVHDRDAPAGPAHFTARLAAYLIYFGINIPDKVKIGFPAAHGGLQTESIPLILKAPAGSAANRPGSEYGGEVRIGDIAPTIYGIMGWQPPACVDGKPLP